MVAVEVFVPVSFVISVEVVELDKLVAANDVNLFADAFHA